MKAGIPPNAVHYSKTDGLFSEERAQSPRPSQGWIQDFLKGGGGGGGGGGGVTVMRGRMAVAAFTMCA